MVTVEPVSVTAVVARQTSVRIDALGSVRSRASIHPARPREAWRSALCSPR